MLIDGAYFDAGRAELSHLRDGAWDDKLDQDWHELHGFVETEAESDDAWRREIDGLLRSLRFGI